MKTIKTEEDNFASSFRFALTQGYVDFGVINFRGWQDG